MIDPRLSHALLDDEAVEVVRGTARRFAAMDDAAIIAECLRQLDGPRPRGIYAFVCLNEAARRGLMG